MPLPLCAVVCTVRHPHGHGRHSGEISNHDNYLGGYLPLQPCLVPPLASHQQDQHASAALKQQQAAAAAAAQQLLPPRYDPRVSVNHPPQHISPCQLKNHWRENRAAVPVAALRMVMRSAAASVVVVMPLMCAQDQHSSSRSSSSSCSRMRQAC